MANRLAADESGGVVGECLIQCPMPLPLHILQLLLIQPEIVTQFMDDCQTDLFADFGLTGADCFDILLIEDDVIWSARQVEYALLGDFG